jgi:acetyl esterase/lipase|tara:strand:+ start:5405 stop:6373 length:969 start_codon:yes stop_codon:yes gene_type:complete
VKNYLLVFIFIFSSGFSLPQQINPKPPWGYPNFTFIEWAVSFGWLDLVDLEPEIPDSILFLKDIVFKDTEQRQLKLDIYKKKSLSSSVPVIIFIHGGSWVTGGKEDYLVYCLAYAQKGYVTASLSYRFSQEAIFPAAVEDIICGIRWIKSHGNEYGIDTSKVALVGGSAGGHLAMMAAYTIDEPQFISGCDDNKISTTITAIVNIYGPTDLTTDFAIAQGATYQFMGTKYEENPSIFKEASPLTYISPDDPPTLIFHGTIDKIVPIYQSDLLDEQLTKNGVEHEYHRLNGWPHTMDAAVPVNEYTQSVMDRFFEKWLKGDIK